MISKSDSSAAKYWNDVRQVKDEARGYAGQSQEQEKPRPLTALHSRLRASYVDSLAVVDFVYDRALRLLRGAFEIPEGEEDRIKLPVDVLELAEKCGFTVYVDENMIQETQPEPGQPWKDGPIAQIQMRERLFGSREGEIAGVIRVAGNLSDQSIRFCIAHELGHFALRTVSPVGIMQIREACPGMYAYVDQDEFLADLFAYALLIPYPAYKRLREQYEQNSAHWPLNFSDWIAYLQNAARIPEYHAVLAHQELKKLQCFMAMPDEIQEAALKRFLDERPDANQTESAPTDETASEPKPPTGGSAPAAD